jgi:antitoxin component YwqK of YwqJK toxin-antitoxin module
MYLCIPKKPEIMNGLLFHSYNNFTISININDFNFYITDFNNQVFLFYIIDTENNKDNKDLMFFIFKDKRTIIDMFYKTTINNEEFNMIKFIGGWFCDTNHLVYIFRDNMLKIYHKKKRLFESNIIHFYPHGLCTEYIDDKIKFVRIYKMGIACGYGTEYLLNEANTPKYVGYFDNYLYHGEGEYFYKSGNLQYKGEFRNGSIFKGTEYYDYNGGIKYEGEFMNNKYNGQGIQYYNGVLCSANIKGKKKYEGVFVNGLYHGEGIKYNNVNGKIQYQGTFSNGKLNGKVLEYDNDEKLIYEGKYSNDSKHGEGSEYTNEKLSFKGEFLNGVYHGIGTRYSKFGFSLGCYTYANGKIQ